MKADRLLTTLMLLQANGTLTGRALAKRLEVSQRTVHRDMDALSAAGVPVLATRGSRGGWQLEDGWRTKVPGLDTGELQALLMAQPRAIGDAGLAASAERALTKLVAALPVNLRAQAATIRQRLFVDATGWRGTTENLAALPVVQDAVWRGRQLRVTYQPSGRAADDRVVHPLGMVAKGTTWYLVADTVKGLRTFRISRILAAAALDVPCVRPAKFDLETHWRTSGDAYREKPRYPATLILEPATASSLCEWMEMRPLPAEQSDPSGWSRWRVDFESASQAGFIALGLGTKVVVVEPADLRRDVVGEHRAAAAGRAAPRSGRRRRQPLP